MELCLLHANCQGEPLARLLSLSPGFRARWRIRHIVNYTRERVDPRDLADCTLFVYQRLGESWGDLASERLVAGLGPRARAVCVPNLFFKGYWPFWTGESSMDFGDICLDYLVDQGLDPAEAVHIYEKDAFIARYRPEELVAESQAIERRREAGAVIELVDYVEEHWKRERLFTTINHPTPAMMRLVANAVLAAVGLQPLADMPKLRVDPAELACDVHFELPIHPAVGRLFHLPFAGADRVYPAYGRRVTFREYALAYADCRRKGLNLHAYLQGVVE